MGSEDGISESKHVIHKSVINVLIIYKNQDSRNIEILQNIQYLNYC